MVRRVFLSSVLLFAFILLITPGRQAVADAGEQATVSAFSPQGEVKGIRQVAVAFSEQMVPMGDPHLADPFEIKCPEKGKGRWADGKNWIYDFDRDLPAGVRCEFTLKDDIKTLSGRSLTGQRRFVFSTGGPAIVESYPPEGSKEIDESQIFILALDADADEGSVLSNVSCSVEGINERVGIRVLKGKESEKILKSQRYPRDREAHVLVLQCRQSFPNNAEMRLIWGKGVKSVSGVGTTKDQILSFKARSPFTASFTCERENPKAACIPVLPMRLRFSSPVPWDTARKILLRGPSGSYRPQSPAAEEGENEEGGFEQGNGGFVYEISFKGPFPENASFTIEIPENMRDDAGRTLENRDNFPLVVGTDSYPPLAKFSSRFGILELKGEPVLPVTLRNLEPAVASKMLKVGKKVSSVEGMTGRLHREGTADEKKIIEWLRRVASAERRQTLFKGEKEIKKFSVPKPGGSKAFEVVGIPLRMPGFYVVEMESRVLGASLLGERKPFYVPTTALVTNLSAHFKWGRESSLVWVTSLDKAEPVRDAAVSIRDCKGNVLWRGKTDSNGLARIRDRLPSEDRLARCPFQPNYGETPHALQFLGEGLFVFARKADDITFVHSSWDEGIEPWRFNLPEEPSDTPVIAHTIFDRTLLRAGDTVHMEHILRRHTMSGFSMPRKNDLPKAVLIHHEGSDQKYEFPLKWDRKGIALTEWKIPSEAKLGLYRVTLLKKATSRQEGAEGGKTGDGGYADADGYLSGSFRVEEFRVPLMKAVIQPPKEPLINPSEIVVDLQLSYLSGGGAGNAQVKLRSRTEPRFISFEDYEDFTFGNGRVKEGTIRGAAGEETEEHPAPKGKLHSVDLTLDKTGSLRTTITDLPPLTSPMDLLSELEFRDPNGEIQTVARKIPLWPSGLLVGIKPDSWASSKEAFKFHVLTLDIQGKPAADREVKVGLFQRKYYSHRKRLVGGFYSYEHVTETKRVGDICEGKTDARGLLVCEVQSPVSGNVILQAEAVDNAGNAAVAHRDVWIAGKGEWWFDVSDNDRIDLLPERKRYEPGETAVFQVRMPFRSATALVTVEREGILDTYIKNLSGKTPVIEIPVKGDYAPNVFVSALVVRGRVSGIQPTAMADMGRPAYKLGIAEIRTGWKAHELTVALSPEKTVYKVREKARVKIRVAQKDGDIPPKGSEVTVAAVDEGLLELMPNKSWDLLDAMMGRRGYEVKTSTAQMQVVGKRHYGLKALPQGGGGGRQATRELFDTLLLWKARVPLDSGGEASVEIPLNDSLTGFRIAGIAYGGTGLFGTGQTSIRTTQDLMILSGIPQLVREGDTFRAGFTIRNASERAMDVEIEAKMAPGAVQELPVLHESLAAGEAKEVGWEIHVPQGIGTLSYEVTAREKNGDARDSLRVKQKIGEAVPARTIQATLSQVEKRFDLDVEKPKGSVSQKGGVSLLFSPTLSNGLGGVIEYMKRYPYTCMEQKVSKAIALKDGASWKSIVAELPSYLDQDGLVKYFPKMVLGSDTLTSYLLSISHEAGWKIPAETEKRMEKGLRDFVEGKIIRSSSLATADLSIRKIAALEALSRSGKAEAKLLGSISLEPNLWPTSAVIDWMNLLMRVPDIPDREKRLKEAEQILRSRLNFQGTTLGFSTERSDYLWWLMASPDLNAVKSILTLSEFGSWREDIPRLVRAALGRQHRGAWTTTTANAWGVLAIEKFSKKFEGSPVRGTTSANLGGKTKTIEWKKAVRSRNISFPWPGTKEKLTVSHKGTGKPWVTVQSIAAVPLKEPFSSGYRIRKSLIPVERKAEGKWSRGDVIRVRLELEAQADMTWVVVNDPIPAGSSILGTGLGRDSGILPKDEERQGWVWPAFEERSFDSFRAYYEVVPKGKWTVEYTIRLNNSGTFHIPPTRVEALYAPEMLGEIPNQEMEVR